MSPNKSSVNMVSSPISNVSSISAQSFPRRSKGTRSKNTRSKNTRSNNARSIKHIFSESDNAALASTIKRMEILRDNMFMKEFMRRYGNNPKMTQNIKIKKIFTSKANKKLEISMRDIINKVEILRQTRLKRA